MKAHAMNVLAVALLTAYSARADEPGSMKECPMHAAHMAAAQAHRQGVDERHDQATGVSHADSVHHFSLFPDGGRIRLEMSDEADPAGRDQIRVHLRRVAREFSQGQFDMPMLIHDRVPPGVDVMRSLRSAIQYRYAPTPRGGQADITTTNANALAAVHSFLRFQIEDHATGDSAEVAAR